MKESPQDRKLDDILRSSRLVAGGFMGHDRRDVHEIIDADVGTLAGLGLSKEQLALRMRQITELAKPGLGTWIEIDRNLQAKVDEARGRLVCPWPHSGCFSKRITTVRVKETDACIRWSDLNAHLIGEHGFFGGRGSDFRVEPAEFVRLIF